MNYEEIANKVNEVLDFIILNTEKTTINIKSILFLIVVFFATRLILNLVKRFFRQKENAQSLTSSQNYILQKITQYVIIIAAIIIALQSIGLELTFLLAGSAALFVGIGLGIQDVFKDVIAGFILLFGKAIKVGDVIEVEGVVGRVMDIDFRVSKIVNRDDIDMLVPNSKLISDNVINWSYNNKLTRFSISVGVAYGSDTQLVKKILLKVAKSHADVALIKDPFVRFTDFGNSSLDFQLFFWSEKTFRIENIFSDMRFEIDNQFRANNVTIPFPQRDVHIKQEK